MNKYDINEELFELTDKFLEHTVPWYKDQLEEGGIHLDYLWIDKTIQTSLQISMEDRAFWYLTLEDLINKALEEGLVTEYEYENYLMITRLGLTV